MNIKDLIREHIKMHKDKDNSISCPIVDISKLSKEELDAHTFTECECCDLGYARNDTIFCEVGTKSGDICLNCLRNLAILILE